MPAEILGLDVEGQRARQKQSQPRRQVRVASSEKAVRRRSTVRRQYALDTMFMRASLTPSHLIQYLRLTKSVSFHEVCLFDFAPH